VDMRIDAPWGDDSIVNVYDSTPVKGPVAT
jgi:hypothetical protein